MTMRRTNYSEGNVNFCIDSRYQIEEVLGKGSYGTVCRAVQINSVGEPTRIAIKRVTDIFKKEVLLKRAIRELKLMKHFKGHKNIVSLIDIDLIHQKPYEGLYCYQELVEYDLAKVIYSNIQFSEFHIQSFIYQIACGLNYIHGADVIHRDLKPGNILVSVDGVLKICDFGLARGINNEFMNRVKTVEPITNYVATRWYRAPELMLSDKIYDKSVDLWAVGCIICEFYGRKPLFVGKDQLHQIQEIMKVLGSPPIDLKKKLHWKYTPANKLGYLKVNWQDLYPYATNKLIYELMNDLLQWDPSSRLTIEDVIHHQYLADIRNDDLEIKCDKIFNFNWENQYNSIYDLKDLIQLEANTFKAERKVSQVPST